MLYCLWAIIIYRYGDLNYEWKECAQNQISAYAVVSVDYHTNDLDHVHPGMQLGNTRLLIERENEEKSYRQRAAGIMNDFHATTTSGVFERDGHN